LFTIPIPIQIESIAIPISFSMHVESNSHLQLSIMIGSRAPAASSDEEDARMIPCHRMSTSNWSPIVGVLEVVRFAWAA
jgi:hypothetical protein